MQKKNSSKNVFDEIDRDIDKFKTAIKISRYERIFNTQKKILQGFIIILLIFAAIFIGLGILRKLNIADILMGIIFLISAVQCKIFLKKIQKTNHRKGGKS